MTTNTPHYSVGTQVVVTTGREAGTVGKLSYYQGQNVVLWVSERCCSIRVRAISVREV